MTIDFETITSLTYRPGSLHREVLTIDGDGNLCSKLVETGLADIQLGDTGAVMEHGTADGRRTMTRFAKFECIGKPSDDVCELRLETIIAGDGLDRARILELLSGPTKPGTF